MREWEQDGTDYQRHRCDGGNTCNRCGVPTDLYRVFEPTKYSPAQRYTPRYCEMCESLFGQMMDDKDMFLHD